MKRREDIQAQNQRKGVRAWEKTCRHRSGRIAPGEGWNEEASVGSVSEDARCDVEETDDADGSSSGSEATSTEGEGHGWRWGEGWWWENCGQNNNLLWWSVRRTARRSRGGADCRLEGIATWLNLFPAISSLLSRDVRSGVDGASLIRRCTQMISAPLGEVATMHGNAEDGMHVYEDETPECIKPFWLRCASKAATD